MCNNGSLGPYESSSPKRQLDRFSRFCMVHRGAQHTDEHIDNGTYNMCSNRPHLRDECDSGLMKYSLSAWRYLPAVVEGVAVEVVVVGMLVVVVGDIVVVVGVVVLVVVAVVVVGVVVVVVLVVVVVVGVLLVVVGVVVVLVVVVVGDVVVVVVVGVVVVVVGSSQRLLLSSARCVTPRLPWFLLLRH